MKIVIIAVGKIKEKFYRDALQEYEKRLARYCKLEIKEVIDESIPDHTSDAMDELIKKKEAERILKLIKADSFVISLEISGEKKTSIQFSDILENLGIMGKSHITFIIGGSLGLHKDVSDRANTKLSFSAMTFPHQLMRVILLEQIYRAYRIQNKEPYHK